MKTAKFIVLVSSFLMTTTVFSQGEKTLELDENAKEMLILTEIFNYRAEYMKRAEGEKVEISPAEPVYKNFIPERDLDAYEKLKFDPVRLDTYFSITYNQDEMNKVTKLQKKLMSLDDKDLIEETHAEISRAYKEALKERSGLAKSIRVKSDELYKLVMDGEKTKKLAEGIQPIDLYTSILRSQIEYQFLEGAREMSSNKNTIVPAYYSIRYVNKEISEIRGNINGHNHDFGLKKEKGRGGQVVIDWVKFANVKADLAPSIPKNDVRPGPGPSLPTVPSNPIPPAPGSPSGRGKNM